MNAHLTKRLIDSLEVPPAGQRLRVFDDKLVGFAVVVQPTGRKSFIVQYGPAERRQRITLGQYGALTVDQARAMAIAKLAEVAQGVNPRDEQERREREERAARAAREEEERRASLTFAGWRDTYLAGVRLRKKQARHDEHYLAAGHEPKKHARKPQAGDVEHPIVTVAKRWGARPLEALTRADIEAAMLEVAARGSTTGNRWLAAVRACLQEAVERGVLVRNPAMGVRPYRENAPRARVLTDAEFARVVDAFEALPDPHVRAAFVLLMDTGARKSEVLHAAWGDFDLEGRLWRIPSPKAGRPQMVPLTDSTVSYLQGVERLGPFLVPGRDATRSRSDLRRAWDHVRELASVEDVTIHDLRRTFGLHVARRAGLHIASKLLRHADIRVTERVYAPLGLDAMREAAADMNRERGKLVELRRRGV